MSENNKCASCKFAEDYNGVSFKCAYVKEHFQENVRYYPEQGCDKWESFAGSDAWSKTDKVLTDSELKDLLSKGAKNMAPYKVSKMEECKECHGKGFKVIILGFGSDKTQETIQCKECGGTGVV